MTADRLTARAVVDEGTGPEERLDAREVAGSGSSPFSAADRRLQARCRGCGSLLDPADALCDLGTQPLANALLTQDDLDQPVVHYPLRPLVCRNCVLVQLPDVPVPESIFSSHYPFYSGQSVTWMTHCASLAKDAVGRFGLGPTSRVLDIGSNDGTMLRPFRGRGIPCLGVEPSTAVAQHAIMEGLPTVIDWWGVKCAQRLLDTGGVPTGRSWRADFVTCTNVLAHVPDLKDFLDGVRLILAPGGTVVFEFPYVGNLIEQGQFDQIYAEHHCYFSLNSLNLALRRSGLRMTEVQWMPLHGGSARVYAEPSDEPAVGHALAALKREIDRGLWDVETYLKFAEEPAKIKRNAQLLLAEFAGKRIWGYGASAKAGVTLNYFGLGTEWFEAIADTTPAKWGKYLPGCRIPIRTPDQMAEAQPDVVVLLAWNWAKEALPKIEAACPNAEIIQLSVAGSSSTTERLREVSGT